MNNPQETNRSLPPQEGLESPFLNEAMFFREGQDEWEAGLTRLEAESPFLNAYQPGAVPAETEAELFHPNGLEVEGEISPTIINYLIDNGLPENQITDEVFYNLHPAMRGKALQPKSSQAKQWLSIRDDVVRPAVKHRLGSWTVDPVHLALFFSQYEGDSRVPHEITEQFLSRSPLLSMAKTLRDRILWQWQSGNPPVTLDLLYKIAYDISGHAGTAMLLGHNVTKAFTRGGRLITWDKDPDHPETYRDEKKTWTPKIIHPAGKLIKKFSKDYKRELPSIYYLLFSEKDLGLSDPGDWYHYFVTATYTAFGGAGELKPAPVEEEMEGNRNPATQIVDDLKDAAYPLLVQARVLDLEDQMSMKNFASQPGYRGWVLGNVVSFLEGGHYGENQEEAGRESRYHLRGAIAGLSVHNQKPGRFWLWFVPIAGSLSDYNLARGFDLGDKNAETLDSTGNLFKLLNQLPLIFKNEFTRSDGNPPVNEIVELATITRESLVDLEAEASDLYQQDLLYPIAQEVEEEEEEEEDEEDPSFAEILEAEDEENLVLEEAEPAGFENTQPEFETASSPYAETGIESEEFDTEEDLAVFEDQGTRADEELFPAAGYEIEAEADDLFGDAGEAVEEEQELDPSLGKTYYLPVQLNKSLPPKVGVFIPSSVNPASTRNGVDLIVYFHGHMIRDCEKNPEKFDRDGIEHYWNTPLFICLREELARSGQPAILIAPTLHPFLARSEAGYGNLNQAGKFDFLINETMKGLAAQGALPADAQVRRIILSGHSGGGLPMQKILSAKNAFNKQVVECWGFECLYFGLGDWASWLKANSGQHFLHFRQPSFKQDETKNLLKFSNFRDVNNASGHCGILKAKWREALDGSPALHGGRAPVPAAASSGTSGILSLLTGLPGLAALPLVFMTTLLKGIRDENQLTNLIFFTRHPELGGRKLTAADPKSLKDEWISILKNTVRPALQRIQTGGSAGSPGVPPAPGRPSTNLPAPAAPSLPAPSASSFSLTELELEPKKIVIASAGDKKKGTEVLIEEAPAIFLPKIVAMARDMALKDKKLDLAARLDPVTWFKQFTRITFLGRELGEKQYVHLELAQRLKAIEAQMVQTFGGSPKSVGDLLLKNSAESIAGSRLTSSTSTFSMHMLGLAVDVNYKGNPYIQKHAIPTLNRVLSSAAGLLNLPEAVYTPGRGFDSIQNLDSLLEKYFALLDSPAELEQLAAKSQAAEWRGLSSAAAREKIQKHLDGLAPLVARGDTKKAKYKNYFKQHGILNFDKRFVTQMEALGMHWGGEYGDMMHFDLRRTGVGYYIQEARSLYRQQARDQARSFYNQKSYGPHPAGEAEFEDAEDDPFRMS